MANYKRFEGSDDAPAIAQPATVQPAVVTQPATVQPPVTQLAAVKPPVPVFSQPVTVQPPVVSQSTAVNTTVSSSHSSNGFPQQPSRPQSAQQNQRNTTPQAAVMHPSTSTRHIQGNQASVLVPTQQTAGLATRKIGSPMSRYRSSGGKATGLIQVVCACFSMITSMVVMYFITNIYTNDDQYLDKYESVVDVYKYEWYKPFSDAALPFWAGLVSNIQQLNSL